MKKIFLFFTILILFSCEKRTSKAYSFYYWRTKLSLNKIEKEALEKSTSPYLYTRFFDMDKINGKFLPIAVLTKDASFVTNKKIVPVVFIKNEIFYYLKPEESIFLAQNIIKLIHRKKTELKLNLASEIQIDCDWNAGTNKEYFDFLKNLKKCTSSQITCTIRLHQVKDHNIMGIPPVEKGYLMCYSTSSPLENSDKNSILDITTLKNYLKFIGGYDLKLDVALPIYSWGIVTNHLGKHKLINALTEADLEKNLNFKKISTHEFEILKDGFYFGNYLNRGFKIKIESVSQKDLDETVNYLNKKMIFRNFNIIYYHLDSIFVKNYDL